MHYLQNHCWCSRSHWDGENYDCRHIVSFNAYQDEYKNDWNNLIDPDADSYFDSEWFDAFIVKFHPEKADDEDIKLNFTKRVPNLKPHVLKWLEDNVKDRPDKDSPKGWCIGDSSYRHTNVLQMTVFFHRRADALAFVKEFSKWKKPTTYYNYFKSEMTYLNLETLKYQKEKP